MKKSLANTFRKQITSLQLSSTCALSTEPTESQSHKQETGCHEQLLNLERGNKDSGRQSTHNPRQNPLFIISVTLKCIRPLSPKGNICLFRGRGVVEASISRRRKKKPNKTNTAKYNWSYYKWLIILKISLEVANYQRWHQGQFTISPHVYFGDFGSSQVCQDTSPWSAPRTTFILHLLDHV